MIEYLSQALPQSVFPKYQITANIENPLTPAQNPGIVSMVWPSPQFLYSSFYRICQNFIWARILNIFLHNFLLYCADPELVQISISSLQSLISTLLSIFFSKLNFSSNFLSSEYLIFLHSIPFDLGRRLILEANDEAGVAKNRYFGAQVKVKLCLSKVCLGADDDGRRLLILVSPA